MTRTLAFLALTIALLAPARAQAQFAVVPVPPMPIDSGQRIRIGVTSDQRQSPFALRVHRLGGILLRATIDSVVLDAPAVGPIAIARAEIRSLELSLGRSPRRSALALGALSAVLSAVQMVHRHHAEDAESRQYATARDAAAVGLLLGFGTGALFGWSMAGERWHPARLPE